VIADLIKQYGRYTLKKIELLPLERLQDYRAFLMVLYFIIPFGIAFV